MSIDKIDLELKKHRIIICVGSGGVGKTTISAALGIRAAQIGLNTLVLTIDPSLRLKKALGIVSQIDGAITVPGQNYLGRLSAMLLQSENLFKKFIMKATVDKNLSEKLLKNRLYKQLSTTLSGSQEFTSLLQLTEIVNENEYDLIILDTPPAQHAVDFLEAPEKILALFQDRVVRWFIGDNSNLSFLNKVFSKGTRTILKALEKITGSNFMTELSDFFISVRSVQNSISAKSSLITQILKDKKTAFILVTGFAEAKIIEAENLRAYLVKKNFHLCSVIINRAFHKWSKNTGDYQVPSALGKEYQAWIEYHQKRKSVYDKYSESWLEKLPVVQLPEINDDISGLEGLEGVANEIANAFAKM